jgi:hypothetical protein
LGVDSTAYLVKMLEDPAAHGVDLARTLVMHQLTGDGWPATRAHADISKSSYQNLRNARGEFLRQLSGCVGVLEAGRLLNRAGTTDRTLTRRSMELVTRSCRAVLVGRGRDPCDDSAVRDGASTQPWIVDDGLWTLIEQLLPPWPEKAPGQGRALRRQLHYALEGKVTRRQPEHQNEQAWYLTVTTNTAIWGTPPTSAWAWPRCAESAVRSTPRFRRTSPRPAARRSTTTAPSPSTTTANSPSSTRTATGRCTADGAVHPT